MTGFLLTRHPEERSDVRVLGDSKRFSRGFKNPLRMTGSRMRSSRRFFETPHDDMCEWASQNNRFLFSTFHDDGGAILLRRDKASAWPRVSRMSYRPGALRRPVRATRKGLPISGILRP